jgi:hypothetical protein
MTQRRLSFWCSVADRLDEHEFVRPAAVVDLRLEEGRPCGCRIGSASRTRHTMGLHEPYKLLDSARLHTCARRQDPSLNLRSNLPEFRLKQRMPAPRAPLIRRHARSTQPIAMLKGKKLRMSCDRVNNGRTSVVAHGTKRRGYGGRALGEKDERKSSREPLGAAVTSCRHARSFHSQLCLMSRSSTAVSVDDGTGFASCPPVKRRSRPRRRQRLLPDDVLRLFVVQQRIQLSLRIRAGRG